MPEKKNHLFQELKKRNVYRVATVYAIAGWLIIQVADVIFPYFGLPDWIVTGSEPVPLTPAFRSQAMTTQIYAFIMSLIDGKRSLKDMAVLLEKQRLMTREEGESAIRSFLTKMYDDSQRQSGF